MTPAFGRILVCVLAVGAATVTEACHNRARDQAAMAPCDSVAQQPTSDMNLDQLNGQFDVVFVATRGPKSGETARGRLVLHPQDAGLVTITRDSNRVVSQPSIGQLDVAIENVGAVRLGDPMSESNSTPGVGLYVTRLPDGGVAGVIARVGSGANVRDVMMFDGGYFTLELRQIGNEGIYGSWRSAPGAGGPATPDARGHFCATRIASPG